MKYPTRKHLLISPRLIIMTALWLAVVGNPSPSSAQFPDEVARQQVERLRQQDAQLQSSISGQRVDRQAEIARLEGRIADLERSLRRLSPPTQTADLVALLGMLGRPQPAASQSEAAQSDATQSDTTDSSDAEQDAAPEQEPAERVVQTTTRSSSVLTDERLVQLVAHDYMAGLEVESLEAEAEVLEHSQQFASLERLAMKGLATQPQLELARLRLERARAAHQRLQRQHASLMKLWPDIFPQPPSPAAELPRPQPSSPQP